jgi:hypothetical protein
MPAFQHITLRYILFSLLVDSKIFFLIACWDRLDAEPLLHMLGVIELLSIGYPSIPR